MLDNIPESKNERTVETAMIEAKNDLHREIE